MTDINQAMLEFKAAKIIASNILNEMIWETEDENLRREMKKARMQFDQFCSLADQYAYYCYQLYKKSKELYEVDSRAESKDSQEDGTQGAREGARNIPVERVGEPQAINSEQDSQRPIEVRAEEVNNSSTS